MGGIKRTNADAAFSDAVRLAAKHACEHCGREGRTECAHIFGRAQIVVRWDTLNAVSLCHTCHRNFTANPLDFHAWLLKHIGPGAMEILNEKRRGRLKNNKATRDEVSRFYRAQIAKMKAQPSHKLESWI